MTDAFDDKNHEKLTKKLTTPPFDPLAVPEVKPGSYEKFVEVADELQDSGRADTEKRDERAFALWESVKKNG